MAFGFHSLDLSSDLTYYFTVPKFSEEINEWMFISIAAPILLQLLVVPFNIYRRGLKIALANYFEVIFGLVGLFSYFFNADLSKKTEEEQIEFIKDNQLSSLNS